jgi:hypothetical protein
MISCLKINKLELIPSYGQEVIFSTYSFIKNVIRTKKEGEKQFQ